jgi:hypothetical protein
MSLIRNGYAVSTRREFVGMLFSAVVALALFDHGAATAQEVKQIKLTEKHIQGLLAASKDMAKLYDGANPDQPDPKLEAAEAVAKKNGFASLDEYDDVSMNVTMIMSGIDAQTKKFTEPPELIKKEIAALKADNPSLRWKRERAWRSLRRRSRTQSPFSSRKTSRWCESTSISSRRSCRSRIRTSDLRIRASTSKPDQTSDASSARVPANASQPRQRAFVAVGTRISSRASRTEPYVRLSRKMLRAAHEAQNQGW